MRSPQESLPGWPPPLDDPDATQPWLTVLSGGGPHAGRSATKPTTMPTKPSAAVAEAVNEITARAYLGRKAEIPLAFLASLYCLGRVRRVTVLIYDMPVTIVFTRHEQGADPNIIDALGVWRGIADAINAQAPYANRVIRRLPKEIQSLSWVNGRGREVTVTAAGRSRKSRRARGWLRRGGGRDPACVAAAIALIGAAADRSAITVAALGVPW